MDTSTLPSVGPHMRDIGVRESADTEFVSGVRSHWDVMSRVAERLCPPGDRDDVLQEALAAAWRQRAKFDPARGTLRSWLLAITANKANRAWRHAADMYDGEASLTLPSVPTDERTDLFAAIRLLTKRQRTAVVLYYYADLGIAETARAMGCSAGTVKSTLHDARERIRASLGKDYS